MKNKKFKKLIEIGKSFQSLHHPFSSIRTFHVTFAIIKNKIISIGINNTKTHPNIKRLNYVSNDGEDLRDVARMHSELNCVLKLKKRLNVQNFKNIIFVNIRLDKMGNLRYAKPCNGCAHLIERIGYKRLYYSNDFGNFIQYEH